MQYYILYKHQLSLVVNVTAAKIQMKTIIIIILSHYIIIRCSKSLQEKYLYFLRMFCFVFLSLILFLGLFIFSWSLFHSPVLFLYSRLLEFLIFVLFLLFGK